MIDINTLIREKNRYIELSNDISLLISQLDGCTNSLELAASKIGDYYTIDEISYDKGSLKQIREELIEKRNNLNSTVLPAINSEISRINSEIRVAEEEIEKAKKEAEAEKLASEQMMTNAKNEKANSMVSKVNLSTISNAIK